MDQLDRRHRRGVRQLFGIGKLIFGELGHGLVLLVIAALAFAWIATVVPEEDAGERGDDVAAD